MSRFTPHILGKSCALLSLALVSAYAPMATAAFTSPAPTVFLQDSSFEEGDELGSAVLVIRNRVFAGAPKAFNEDDQGDGRIMVWEDAGNDRWLAKSPILPPSDSDADFGASLATSGLSLVVGAPASVVNNIASGCVLIYNRAVDGSWKMVQRIVPADPTNGARFGNAIAIDRGTLVVGASGDKSKGSDAGAAYVFERDPGSAVWSQKQKFLAPEGKTEDRYGYSVAVQGDLIAIGAPGHKGGTPQGAPAPAPDAGRIFTFTRSGGSWVANGEAITAEPGPVDALGTAVALDEGRLLAGAPGVLTIDRSSNPPTLTRNTGAAFEFKRQNNRWVQSTVFQLENKRENEFFGLTLAFDRGRLLVGGGFKSGNDANPGFGEVRMWSRPADQQSWSPDARFAPRNLGTLQRFAHGRSVALSGSRVTVGAPLAIKPGADRERVGGVTVYSVPAPKQAPLLPLWLQISAAVSLIGASTLTQRFARA